MLLCVEKLNTKPLAGVEVTRLEDRVVAHTYSIPVKTFTLR